MTWENKELEAIPSESARQRIVGPDQLPEDGQEVSLRPRCLAEYLGQTRIKENLDILTKSPKRLLFTNKILVLPLRQQPDSLGNGGEKEDRHP